MFRDGSLTFQEFATKEPLPLAQIHDAVLEFLQNRDDAALCDAQAVNAYVDEPRMTQDVDVMSNRAADLAEELREYLNQTFHIAVRVREVAGGKGFRVFQIRQPKNRHLVDIRQISDWPPVQLVAEVRVLAPAELIALKTMSYAHRKGQPKGATDLRDLMVLLLAFPDLKSEAGAVMERLVANQADQTAIEAWRQLVNEKIESDETEEW